MNLYDLIAITFACLMFAATAARWAAAFQASREANARAMEAIAQSQAEQTRVGSEAQVRVIQEQANLIREEAIREQARRHEM